MKTLFKSFGYAKDGLKTGLKEERNMKIHLCISVIVIVAGLFLELSRLEWIAIVLCVGIVFAAELFNTALENVVDLISPKYHPVAGKIKDLSAAAVIICAVVSVVVGVIIFGNKLLELMQRFSDKL
jgi:diacylglycerol kinase (ATP)